MTVKAKVKPLAVRINTACQMLDCGRTKLSELVNSGALERVEINGAPRITMASIERLAQPEKVQA
jgi:hypothetical protein